MAATFGFSSVVLLFLVGAAVDYARMSGADLQLQNAADAAVLALAHEARTNTDEDNLKILAADYMAAMLPAEYDFEVVSVARNGTELTLRAAGSLPAGISGVAGYTEFRQAAVSVASWGTGKVEILLVLDNTGSMARFNRMTELKKAAHALLDQLADAEPGLVKVGIVPFGVNVRVPTSYRMAGWIAVPPWLDWKGCIADRNQPYDVGDAPAISSQTRYPASECSSGYLQNVQPLTDDFAALHLKVNGMHPAGNTNITIGLSWGLALLSPELPFTEGAPFGTEDLKKVVVLMTDGDNTENRWTKSVSAIDERTRLACQSVKAAGVTLYTVRLIEGNPDLLRDCASNPGTYYDVETVQDLVPVFRSIGEELSQLRIAR